MAYYSSQDYLKNTARRDTRPVMRSAYPQQRNPYQANRQPIDYQRMDQTIVDRNAQQAADQLRQSIEQSQKTAEPGSEDHRLKKDDSYYQTTYASHRFLYWTGLAFLLIINFLIAIVLLPLILIMKGSLVYIIVGGIGLLFGLIFDFLVKDLEHLERSHHLFAALLIPIIAIMNLVIISFVSKNVGHILGVKIAENPLIASSVYLLAFMGPFAYSLLIKKEID